MEPIIRLHQVTYHPRTATQPIVKSLSVELYPAEVLVLLGPSGSGKTTTLRLIAGLELPDDGLITIRGVPAGRTMPPEARRVGMVFQDYALFPHMTVLENVRFALHATPKPQQLDQAMHAIAQVGLAGLEQRMPHQLSGGQQQRVAIARALAPQPSVILLDEPFSNLDTAIRDRVRTELRTILRAANTAAIIVTHDQTEALAIADRVALLHDGILHQIGTPEALYGEPRTRFAAQFMGSADFVSVNAQFHTPLGSVTPVGTVATAANLSVLVRYDDIAVTIDTTQPNAEVIERLFEGPHYHYTCRLDNGECVHCRTPHETKIPIGQRIALSFASTHPMVCFAAEVACGHVTAVDTSRRS
jgi:iron(III) transport system ATP-binding protein